MGAFGEAQANAIGVLLGISEMLLKDIPDDRFARLPEGKDGPINTNHPAFALGHLSLYPPRLIALTRGEEAPEFEPTFNAVFAAGVECKDDPDGSIYPSRADVVDRFNTGYKALMEALRAMPDDMVGQPITDERWRERFPTVGAALSFVSAVHISYHLGQLSAWRRAEGLGSVT